MKAAGVRVPLSLVRCLLWSASPGRLTRTLRQASLSAAAGPAFRSDGQRPTIETNGQRPLVALIGRVARAVPLDRCLATHAWRTHE